MKARAMLRALMLLLVLAGCTQPPTPETVTVCRSGGCVEQARTTQTYDPASAVPDPDPDGRIAALEELARQDPSAAYDLGLRFYRGDGIRRDSYQALQWMRDAADRGDVRAQAAVGRLYYTGLEEMGPDLGEAEKWLTLAAGQGDAEARKLLAEVREARADDEAYKRRLKTLRATTSLYWASASPYYWGWHPYRRWYYLP